MKKLILLIAFLCAASGSALAQSAPPFRLEEVDGSPSVLSPTRIKVTNGTLSCSGKVCTITIAGGAGTVTSVAFTGGLISVADPTAAAALTVAGTSGGIPYFSGATTWATSAALAANAIVIGGGAGAAPATTTTGTGILTFLGTPSSANLATALTDETGTGLAVFGTAPTFASTMTIGTAGGTTGAIDLKGTTSGTVTLTTAAAAGTYTLTLPVDDGTASQFLQTDGAGVLTWATSGSGITIGTTTITSGTGGRLLYETSGNVVGEVVGSSADASGNVLIGKHMAVGNGAAVNAAVLLNLAETFTATGTGITGIVTANPVGAGQTAVAMDLSVESDAANTQVIDRLDGLFFTALHNGEGAVTRIQGGAMRALNNAAVAQTVDTITGMQASAENIQPLSTVTEIVGVDVDATGSDLDPLVIGMRIAVATTNAAAVVQGLFIDDVAGGATNEAIRTGLGNVIFGGTTSVTNGQLTLGLASTTTGKLGLAVSGDADVTTIQAGDAPASAVVYKWPADDPAAAELLKVTSFSGGVATLEWAAASAGAAWSSLTNPSGNLALTMAANTSTFTYNATTSTANLFVLTNGSNDTGTNYVLEVLTPGGSNAKKPFGVVARGALAFEITASGAPSSPGAGVNSERYGLDSAAGGSAGQAFGKQSSAGGADAVALGSSAGAGGDNSVAVGNNATANYARQVAIGRSADAGIFATDAIAIGYAATSGSATTKGIAIGSGANVLYTSAIALGYAATATADNQFVLGSETGPITALYLGEGVTSTTPASVAINATGESGTDQSVASVALNLASAKGTGTGDPGTIGLQFARAGSTGASLNAISDEWRASYSATDTVTLAANIKTSTTALTAATAISSLWTDATHATRTSAITFNTVNSAAALAERFRINGTGVTIGAGATITKVLSATASLDFGATAAGACDLLTITVTGAADGDVVSIGVPTALAASDSYQSFNGYVSAADTVTVKRCNLLNTVTALSNPAAATVRADVIQH